MSDQPPSPLTRMHLVEWAQLAPREGLRLVPAIVILLAAGLALGQPAAAAIATGGALTTGFGANQQFTRSRFGPMLFAVFGTGLAAFIGTEAGGNIPLLLVIALAYGMWCGLLPAIGMGAYWIGQQIGVFLIIASAYAAMDHAVERTLLVAGGGALQILCYLLFVGLEWGRMPRPSLRGVVADAATALAGLRFHLRPSSPRFQFALRFALALFVAGVINHATAMPNGYWITMTTLILMRPDFQDTLARGLGRFFGTFAGAALATLIAHVYEPSVPELAVLVALFAACSFVSIRANYGLFSLFVTGYVVFLLVLAGLAENQVVRSRVIATGIGAAIAVLAQVDFFLLRRRVATSDNPEPPPRA